ncbi:MAG TPA: DUF3488 and transglutaminase-like domain-containing protein, partial [Acidimicrobiales bacterium]|nr:DUF3488 and transglutaminase-like domain-containing protein [Acidimicrobiales bacterium]
MSAPAAVAPAARAAPSDARGAADATLPGTLALTAVSLAAAVGMGRLFADGSYLVPMALAAVVTHAASWACRRAGLGLGVSVLASTSALALTITWVVLPATTTLGIPGPRTLQVALRELSRAADQFGGIVAPVAVTDGFLVAGMLGVGVAAVLGDWGAFRVRNLFEAALPSFAVVVVTATLGTTTHRLWFTGLYLAALFVFLVVHYGWLQGTSAPWFGSRPSRPALTRLGAGMAVGGLALLTALAVGPRLPGADDPPVLDWREGREGSDRSRTTVSPLVDIRGRLVGQSEVEVFSVRSSVRAYWRMTSLDTFDGSIWSFNDRHKRVKERLPGDSPVRADTERAVQDYAISNLSSIWLPAVYEPRRVEGLEDFSYNEALASLVTRDETSNGVSYRVESDIPRPSAAELAQVRSRAPGPDMARFLRLPAVSPRVRALSHRIAAEAGPSPFARARALQDFFHREFVYDLGAQPGHDHRALERFLFATKRGYCEQFAGAYAVMARSMDLPTRVAVGFTPGEMYSDGRYHVRGLNAHAWPEVHIDGFGWVAFEPTPGRGAPGAERYTGLP